MLVHKYVDWNGLAAMLATKRSAGVAPEVNLRFPLHSGTKHTGKGIHSGFETQGRHHQKSEIGVSVAPKWTDILQKYFLKKTHSNQS